MSQTRESIRTFFRLPWTTFASGLRTLQGKEGREDDEHSRKDSGDDSSANDPVDQFIEIGDRVVDQMLELVMLPFPRGDESESETTSPAPPPHSGRDPSPPGSPDAGGGPPPVNLPTFPTETVAITASQRGRLDPSRFVVIGEGLAAGLGNFTVEEFFQTASFPAQLARQMGVPFKQPLMQAPGVGALAGFEASAVAPPHVEQTTVLKHYPPEALPDNLAVPGFKLADALRLRPAEPLVDRENRKQTAANLIFGILGLRRGEGKLPTQLEAALAKDPTFVVVELGYYDVLEAALTGDTSDLVTAPQFRAAYGEILTATRKNGAQVLALTIPDPLDTASFSSLDTAARILRVETNVLTEGYGLQPDDLVTVHGLIEIGCQVTRRELGPLPANAVLSADAANRISRRVREMNDALKELAQQHAAVVYDLAGLFARVKASGITAASHHLSGDYLGGFFTLNGCYPGPTGQALIANEILALLNQHHRSSFPPAPVAAVIKADPAADCRPAEGPRWSWNDLRSQSTQRPGSVPRERRAPGVPGPLQRNLVKRYNSATYSKPSDEPLTLPASMEMVLPLNPQLSFLSDGMRITNSRASNDVQFGGGGDLLFGGLAMFGTSLHGSIRVKFSPPANHVSRFEVSLVDGALHGEDGDLSAPNLYRFPLKENRVAELPNFVCSGELNLQDGLVDLTTLTFGFLILNSGLAVLGQLNAALKIPAAIFKNHDPQRPGSAWAQFTPRPDGQLDLTFHGSAFAPVGLSRYPLPFAGPGNQFATIPTNGTSIHPNVHFSTIEEPAEVSTEAVVELDLPTNEVLEFALSSNRTSFGDGFTLNHPDLGFAQGRSMLAGRVQIQFGERFGDAIPIWVNIFPPSGLLDHADYKPVSDFFPTTLFPGLIGHNGVLRFPPRSYRQNDLALAGDPYDLAIGAVNVHTGDVIGDFLQRGYLIQNVFFALMRVEPNSEKDSFGYRGPARFERDADGRLRYNFNGIYTIPFPPGFKFPQTDMTNAYEIGPNSRLDPFFQIQGVHETAPPTAVKSGSASNLIATCNEIFSVRYSIPADPGRRPAEFIYDNHSQKVRFEMHTLASVNFLNSRPGSRRTDRYDTVTFTGFGRLIFYGPGADDPLNADVPEEVHLATVQISTAPDIPYVSVLLDGGRASSVNTMPSVLEPALLPPPTESRTHHPTHPHPYEQVVVSSS